MIKNPLVRLLFNRGGIGPAMSRAETVEHVNPLIEQHMRLNRSYERVTALLDDVEIAGDLKRLQKTARADVGKLSETVLSAGGVAYNGVELRTWTPDLGTTDAERLAQLLEMEQAFQDDLNEELELNHQIRTEAILEVVQSNSGERLGTLKKVARTARRPTP